MATKITSYRLPDDTRARIITIAKIKGDKDNTAAVMRIIDEAYERLELTPDIGSETLEADDE